MASYFAHKELDEDGNEVPKRQVDWDTQTLCSVIKNRVYGGYADIKLPDGTSSRITTTNRAPAVRWFGQRAANFLKQVDLANDKVSLVPIPSKSVLVGSPTADCVAMELSSALAKSLTGLGWKNVSVVDALRWKIPLQKSHEGGTRSQFELYEALEVVSDVEGYPILVDDVLTSGAHLKASAGRLADRDVSLLAAIFAIRANLSGRAKDPWRIVSDTFPTIGEEKKMRERWLRPKAEKDEDDDPFA